MYIKTSELRHLDVINIEDGSYLGNVCDIDLHPDTGAIQFLVLEKSDSGFFRFLKHSDVEIPWQEVVMVGLDVIIVKTNQDNARTYSRPTWRQRLF